MNYEKIRKIEGYTIITLQNKGEMILRESGITWIILIELRAPKRVFHPVLSYLNYGPTDTAAGLR
jgi:hypothetical protein